MTARHHLLLLACLCATACGDNDDGAAMPPDAGTTAGRSGVSGRASSGGESAEAGRGSAGQNGNDSGIGNTTCDLSCGAGTHCELVPVVCVRAPCPPQPVCLDDTDDTDDTDDADGGAAGVDCDSRKVLCKRVAPRCPAGEVPSVVDACYGLCVSVRACACRRDSDCPTEHGFLQCLSGYCEESYV